MKQTAVEWLENEFKEAHKMFGGIDTNWIKRFEQAKAIEREQIIKAWNTRSKIDSVLTYTDNRTAEQYYTETYESNT